jgi:HSP20 family molecular chaperone IbpA
MSEKTEVTSREPSQAKQGPEAAATLRPPVNIFENAEGITLEADMPGVGKDRLHLQVDQDSLLIEGELQVTVPEAMEALYADVRATRYSRSFALSRELDTEKIEASLKDGVLRLHIPKRAEVRPRKVEVRVD